jgi:hypothetical protein
MIEPLEGSTMIAAWREEIVGSCSGISKPSLLPKRPIVWRPPVRGQKSPLGFMPYAIKNPRKTLGGATSRGESTGTWGAGGGAPR